MVGCEEHATHTHLRLRSELLLLTVRGQNTIAAFTPRDALNDRSGQGGGAKINRTSSFRFRTDVCAVRSLQGNIW